MTLLPGMIITIEDDDTFYNTSYITLYSKKCKGIFFQKFNT